MNNISAKTRFYSSGPVLESFHMVDIHLYDSSLFANCVIVEGSDFTTIVDSGTSNTVQNIINYIYFNNINLEHVLIIPTHHHFDHIGGIPSLIEYLEKKNSTINVITTNEMKPFLMDPSEYEKNAIKGFSKKFVGNLAPISEDYIKIISEYEVINLGDYWSVQLIKTPGHCETHVSPLFRDRRDCTICYLGEAFGINLTKEIFPIPASSAPNFNSEKYINSINKLLNLRPKIDVGIFSHFGGISGNNNIQQTGENAINQYYRFKKAVIELHSKNPSTKLITKEIFRKYKNKLATQTLNSNTNKELSKSLAFTNVYGILIDEGKKKRKMNNAYF